MRSVAVEGELVGVGHVGDPETRGLGGRLSPHHFLLRCLPLGQFQVQEVAEDVFAGLPAAGGWVS